MNSVILGFQKNFANYFSIKPSTIFTIAEVNFDVFFNFVIQYFGILIKLALALGLLNI
jgi:hypothetical protein